MGAVVFFGLLALTPLPLLFVSSFSPLCRLSQSLYPLLLSVATILCHLSLNSTLTHSSTFCLLFLSFSFSSFSLSSLLYVFSLSLSPLSLYFPSLLSPLSPLSFVYSLSFPPSLSLLLSLTLQYALSPSPISLFSLSSLPTFSFLLPFAKSVLDFAWSSQFLLSTVWSIRTRWSQILLGLNLDDFCLESTTVEASAKRERLPYQIMWKTT